MCWRRCNAVDAYFRAGEMLERVRCREREWLARFRSVEMLHRFHFDQVLGRGRGLVGHLLHVIDPGFRRTDSTPGTIDFLVQKQVDILKGRELGMPEPRERGLERCIRRRVSGVLPYIALLPLGRRHTHETTARPGCELIRRDARALSILLA